MSLQQIQSLLDRQPKQIQQIHRVDEIVVQESIRYLSSDEAIRSIDANPYWPKWNSPWWHMAALYEMGLSDRTPRAIVWQLVQALQRQYPQDGSPATTTPCPCELGNIFQILSATGVDVDRDLPWIRSWILGHQMPDGGLSCDDDAYTAHPPASSIVGTIAPLEAILLFTKQPFAPEDVKFLDAGAQCLIERRLMLGSSAHHNAEERLDEADWLKPCFPRFYLYDVLRGLNFILQWAELRRRPIPASAIVGVIASLCEKCPDGLLRVERHAFEGVGSRVQTALGDWERSKVASFFSLLLRISEIGHVSPYLTARWTHAKVQIDSLIRQGLIA